MLEAFGKPLRLVFTSDRVGVVRGVIRVLMTKWVIRGVISGTELESEESEHFHFHPTPLMTRSPTFCLWSSENQIVGVGRRSGRTKPIKKRGNVYCDWFILPLLLPTSTIWFSLDYKRNISHGADLQYKEKSKLNIAIIVVFSVSIVFCLLTIIHLAVNEDPFLGNMEAGHNREENMPLQGELLLRLYTTLKVYIMDMKFRDCI